MQREVSQVLLFDSRPFIVLFDWGFGIGAAGGITQVLLFDSRPFIALFDWGFGIGAAGGITGTVV